MATFPSIKAKRLLWTLQHELGYRVVRQTGSHRRLAAPGRPTFTFAFHDRRTLSPSEVRTVLVKHAGLAEGEARRLL